MTAHATENIERELFRIMECIRKTTTDTKGAVFVALQAAWWDLERVCNQDVADLNKLIDNMRQQIAKLTVEKGDQS